MQVLILAGGMGTRLQSVLEDLPKVMAPVGGKPFLSYIIEQLRRQRLYEICLAIGVGADAIRGYFGDGSSFGVSITYSTEPFPFGTGGAIKLASGQLQEEFLVMNGDSYTEIEFHELIDFHRIKQALMSMALVEREDTNRYGIVEVDQDKRVVAFSEKGVRPGVNLINAGIYAVNKSIFSDVPEHVTTSFEKEILPRYVDNGLFGMRIRGFFTDIGTPASYGLIKNGFPRRN